jgi:hypothetical protein
MNKNNHYKTNILILMIVLLNLFCFSQSTNIDGIKRKAKHDKKFSLGSHWNRIGKRFEFTNDENNNQLFGSDLSEKHQLSVKLKEYISKFLNNNLVSSKVFFKLKN